MTSIRDADFGLNVLKLSGRAVPRNRTVITVTRAAVIRSPQSYRLPLRVSQRTRNTADRVQFQPVCDGAVNVPEVPKRHKMRNLLSLVEVGRGHQGVRMPSNGMSRGRQPINIEQQGGSLIKKLKFQEKGGYAVTGKGRAEFRNDPSESTEEINTCKVHGQGFSFDFSSSKRERCRSESHDEGTLEPHVISEAHVISELKSTEDAERRCHK
ncbi:hypothetical protein BJV77DRAFT_1147150 [Russula vinacea]|nr:hypothetical protein BJV77DRAFT_1147150 [Russula vinacea]